MLRGKVLALNALHHYPIRHPSLLIKFKETCFRIFSYVVGKDKLVNVTLFCDDFSGFVFLLFLRRNSLVKFSFSLFIYSFSVTHSLYLLSFPFPLSISFLFLSRSSLLFCFSMPPPPPTNPRHRSGLTPPGVSDLVRIHYAFYIDVYTLCLSFSSRLCPCFHHG